MGDPLQPDVNAAAPRSTTDTNAAPSGGRLVLRLVVGSALLAAENTGRALQHLGPSVLDDEGTTATALPPPSARHVLIGAMAVGPEWVNERMNQLVRRGGGALVSGVRRVSRPLRFAARFLPTDELRRWSNDVRARVGATALNLAEIGRREERIARTLAHAAAVGGVTSILDRVANSPQVQSVIRDQSAGMGRSAVSDLRAQSARADALAESVVAHLLPHARRNNPGGSGSP